MCPFNQFTLSLLQPLAPQVPEFHCQRQLMAAGYFVDICESSERALWSVSEALTTADYPQDFPYAAIIIGSRDKGESVQHDYTLHNFVSYLAEKSVRPLLAKTALLTYSEELMKHESARQILHKLDAEEIRHIGLYIEHMLASSPVS